MKTTINMSMMRHMEKGHTYADGCACGYARAHEYAYNHGDELGEALRRWMH